MQRFTLTVLVMLALVTCLGATAFAQNPPPPPPAGGPGIPGMPGVPAPPGPHPGMGPAGPGMMGGDMNRQLMPMMQVMAPPAIVVSGDYVYVVAAGVLYQFEAAGLKLVNSVRLAPPGGRGGRLGIRQRGRGGFGARAGGGADKPAAGGDKAPAAHPEAHEN